MKKKRWVIIAIVCVLVGGYTAGIYEEIGKEQEIQTVTIEYRDN